MQVAQKLCLLPFLLLVGSSFYSASFAESVSVDWRLSSLDVIIYDLDFHMKEVDLQWYFTIDVNSSFEARVIYFPKTEVTLSYPGESVNGDWHCCRIDRSRTKIDVLSSNQRWYPFDNYIVKILIGFNVSLQTEDFKDKMSRADFRLEKDIETYWDIKNNTSVFEVVPEDYANYLKDSDETAFQIEIALARKFHQLVTPFLLFWVVPIIALLALLATICLHFSASKDVREGTPSPIVVAGIDSAILITLMIHMQGTQKPPCFTIAEAIIVSALIGSLVTSVVSFFLHGRRREGQDMAIAYPPTRKFNIKVFRSDLENFKELPDEVTRQKLLERMRSQLTSLPLDGMPSKTRDVVNDFLLVISDEIRNEKNRLLCLACISAIYNRRDRDVNARIKKSFLGKIEGIYHNSQTLEEKSKALSLGQKWRDYDFQLLKELLTDAIEKWSKREFEALHRSIEFDKLNKEEILNLKKLLWKWGSESSQEKEKDRVERIDKILDLDVFR